MKRIIPEKLKITSFERLGRDDEEWLEDDKSKRVPEERKSEINNIPTSGIVITDINAFKTVVIKDPRGFYCTISNLDELLTEITIEKRVIQEDLIYGRPNNRSTSWILLTPKMVKADESIVRSAKDLRPAEVYKLHHGFQTVVYLGRLPWRSYYDGVFRERHIFAYPEQRYITAVSIHDASLLTDTGVDDPDLYSEALGALKSSHMGNKDIAVTGLRVRSDLPQIDFSKINSVLFPSDIDTNSYGQRLTGRIALVRQVKTNVLEAISINGYVSRDLKSYSQVPKIGFELLPPRFTVYASLHSIEIKSGLARNKYISNSTISYGPDSSITDLMEGLNKGLGIVINDNEWKCINLKGVEDQSYHDCYSYCDCILNNGNIVSGENLLTHYLNF